MSSKSIRIAKNTLMLYFRQILIMLVNLYTVRIVLSTLGVEDYGIYNVTAGVVVMFGFLSGSISGASQRFFAIEIGRENYKQLNRLFSLSFMLYVAIAVFILVISETVGLWFVRNKLVIPAVRLNAALWVYHFSIIAFIFTILTAPYMAMVIAYEEMNIYAYVSIVEALLKFVIVILLRIIQFDKLKLYGILLCIVAMINTTIYRIICLKKYHECKFKFYWDKKLFEEIINYVGFGFLANFSLIIRNNGLTIMLNQFFSSTVIAARSISLSVNGVVSSFAFNFRSALTPQIIKRVAISKNKELFQFVFFCVKGTFFLTFVFVLPIMLEIPFVLFFWLGHVPEYTAGFISLSLIDILIMSVSSPLATLVEAIGKIRLYYSIYCGINLLNFPISLLALYLKAPPHAVMIISAGLTIVFSVFLLLFLRKIINFPVLQYLKNILLSVFFVFFSSSVLPIILHCLLPQGLLRFFAVTIASVVGVIVFMYLLGFDSFEKIYIKDMTISKFKKVFVNIQKGSAK